MRLLVTGKNGYVASQLVPFLRNQRHEVFTTSRTKDQDPFNFAMGDVRDKKDWASVVKGIEVVIHLAARVHVREKENEASTHLFMQCNYEALKPLAEAALQAGVKKFIFFSSIFVNGCATSQKPFSEKDAPHPENAYALSKLKAENFLLETYGYTPMKILILRPPMIYGKGAKGNWESLVNLCKKPLPLPFKSFDQNKRNFLFIGNLLEAVSKMVVSAEGQGIYPLCDEESLSTYEFVRAIRKALKMPPMLYRFPFLKEILKSVGKEDIYQKLNNSLLIDSSRFKTDFDWRPPYTTFEGINIALS